MRWPLIWRGSNAALAYFHLNRDEIEADLLANSEESVRHEIERA